MVDGKHLTRVDYRLIGEKWFKIDIDCNGNESEPVEVPCNCGENPETEPPLPPIVPDAQTCAIANNLAMLAYNASKYLFDQCTGQPDNWFGNLIIAANFRSLFTETGAPQEAIHSYMMANRAALLDMGYDLGGQTLTLIQQEFVCAAYRALQFSGGMVDSAWRDNFVALITLNTAGTMGTEEAWDALETLFKIIPVSGWQYYSLILSSNTTDPETIGIIDLINLSCGECNFFGSIECEDYQIDGYFHLSGSDLGFTPIAGLLSQYPADIFNNLPFGNAIETTRTLRSFEAINSCVAPTVNCRAAGVEHVASAPFSLCSLQMTALIYNVPPPGLTTHSANSSRIALFYKVVGNNAWQLLLGKVFAINNGQIRYIRWGGVAIENVTAVAAIHWSGGSYAAIDRVLINRPLDLT